jgi:hypothetical protein
VPIFAYRGHCRECYATSKYSHHYCNPHLTKFILSRSLGKKKKKKKDNKISMNFHVVCKYSKFINAIAMTQRDKENIRSTECRNSISVEDSKHLSG